MTALWIKKTATDKSTEIVIGTFAYLSENQGWLKNVMHKDFASDFHRVRYYSTIVASKLHDFKPKPNVEITKHEKAIDISGVGPINYKPRETGRGLDFLEE